MRPGTPRPSYPRVGALLEGGPMRDFGRRSAALGILAIAMTLSLTGVGAARAQDTAGLVDTTFAAAKVRPHIEVSAFPFDLKAVRLLDGPFRAAMERDRTYMMSLDGDRLLHMFRVTAGLPSRAEAYGG